MKVVFCKYLHDTIVNVINKIIHKVSYIIIFIILIFRDYVSEGNVKKSGTQHDYPSVQASEGNDCTVITHKHDVLLRATPRHPYFKDARRSSNC